MSIQLGAAFEQRAQQFLERQRLTLVIRNYRCRGGEIDLIMRDRAGTVVFVEVRARRDARFGDAAASITAAKRQRLVHAAQHYLVRCGTPWPACRFDAVLFDSAGAPRWLRNVFDVE